jgi:hypothetical protein
MASRQNLVVTQKRAVVLLNFSNESPNGNTGTYALSVTGNLFDAYTGLTSSTFPTGLSDVYANAYTKGVTATTAAISRVLWTSNGTTNGYVLTWAGLAPGSTGVTAIALVGDTGEYEFDSVTLRNNNPFPSGIIAINTLGTTQTGTLILEIVQSSGTVGNTQ